MGQGLATGRTPRSTPKEANHGRIPQRPNGRTSWQRRNYTTSHATILVAFDENLASRLCLGLRNLPTKQDPHTPTKNPHLPNPNNRGRSPFPTCLPQSHHPTSQKPRTRRSTNNRRSRVYSCSRLPPLLNYGDWPGNCPTLSGQRVSMVRPSLQTHIRS